MKKVILITLGVVVGLLVVFLIAVAMQPAEFRVARSAKIDAAPDEVFSHVNNFHKWDAWSPWAKLDPNAKNSYSGPDAGEGATFQWDGNDDVGEGSMTITESKPSELIRINLKFVRPFEDKADVAFNFKPVGQQTEVTWEMSGKNNFIAKAMCLFMDMEEMIGSDFERGLANMKEAIEEENADDDSAAPDVEPENPASETEE